MTPKEFFSRWKEGIQKITPMQQTAVNLMGNVLVVVGVIIGLITTFLVKLWWLFIILSGSLLLTTMGLVGTLQKYFVLKKINETLREVQNEHQSTS